MRKTPCAALPSSKTTFGLHTSPLCPPVSATILKVWQCRTIDDASYVAADFRLHCSGPDGINPTWATYRAIALAGFLIYIGAPPKRFRTLTLLFEQ
jgi:hypothetical protein